MRSEVKAQPLGRPVVPLQEVRTQAIKAVSGSHT